LPELYAKIEKTFTENGLAEVLLKIGVNFNFYVEEWNKLLDALNY
jgi:hypothetical protein